MKNFWTLFGYEMKKLLKRKLSWAVVLVLTGFCVWGVVHHGPYGPGWNVPVFDEDGNETGEIIRISPEELYETRQKTAGVLDGRVMDDELFQEMLASVPSADPSNPAEVYAQCLYFWREDATYHSVYNMVDGLFQEPETVTAEGFYAAQWEQTRIYCEKYGGGRLSPPEVDYWMEQSAKLQRPFVYQDDWRGTTYAIDYMYILIGLLPVAAAVCVGTVFPEDRRTRVDALVFATRKSRMPLYLAKVLAGATVAALAGLVIVGATAITFLAVWGTDGLDAPFQMCYIASPRPAAIWQILLPMLVLLVLYTLVCGGIAMLVSALTRSAIVGLAVPVLLVQVLDRWAPMPYGWAGYLPDNLMGWSGPYNVELVKVLGVYLDNFQFGPILYLGITAVLLALCWLGWRRSALGRT